MPLSIYNYYIAVLALMFCLTGRAFAAVPEAAFGVYPQRDVISLGSAKANAGIGKWQMLQVTKAASGGDQISQTGFSTGAWSPAMVPGTVLTNLVANGVYPDPYHGLNNAHEKNLIPDISEVGAKFYTYWFRTEFTAPASFKGRRVWMQFAGHLAAA